MEEITWSVPEDWQLFRLIADVIGLQGLSISLYMYALQSVLLHQAPRNASLGNKRPGRQFWNEHIFMLLS